MRRTDRDQSMSIRTDWPALRAMAYTGAVQVAHASTADALGDAHVVSAFGEMDLDNRMRLDDVMAPVLSRSGPGDRLVLDLSGLTFMDSAGLGTTIQLLRTARGRGVRVAVVVHHQNLVRLFAMTGMARAFPVVGTVEKALAQA